MDSVPQVRVRYKVTVHVLNFAIVCKFLFKECFSLVEFFGFFNKYSDLLVDIGNIRGDFFMVFNFFHLVKSLYSLVQSFELVFEFVLFSLHPFLKFFRVFFQFFQPFSYKREYVFGSSKNKPPSIHFIISKSPVKIF